MKQYTVTGMSCAACSARVEKAVSYCHFFKLDCRHSFSCETALMLAQDYEGKVNEFRGGYRLMTAPAAKGEIRFSLR